MITKTMYVRTVTKYPDPADGANSLNTVGLSVTNPATAPTGPGPINQTLDALSDADAAAFPYGQAVTVTFSPVTP